MVNFFHTLTTYFNCFNKDVNPPSQASLAKENLAAKEMFAKRIQQCFRDYVEKKGGLSQPSYDEYRKLIKVTASMERAEGGVTHVFIPRSHPAIVLKKSGEKEAIKRFEQMEQVRSVLSGQKSSHLTVPQGAVLQEFMIEEKLPIQADRFHNMGLYIKDPCLFDEAIRELARMFSKLVLGDLVSPQNHPSSNIVGDVVRWDNLPLYIEEKEGVKIGKIGFVDLEHISKATEESSARSYETLARIFPYHLPLLLEESKKLGLQVNEEAMKKQAARGEKYLNISFVTHAIWMKVNAAPSVENLALNPVQLSKIAGRIEKELLMISRGRLPILDKKYHCGDFCEVSPGFKEKIGDHSQEAARNLTAVLLSSLSKEVSQEILKLSKDPSRPEMSLRSLCLRRKELYLDVANCLESDYSFGTNSREAADQLLFALFEELAEEGILFSFDHGFNTGGHEQCWIRF